MGNAAGSVTASGWATAPLRTAKFGGSGSPLGVYPPVEIGAMPHSCGWPGKSRVEEPRNGEDVAVLKQPLRSRR